MTLQQKLITRYGDPFRDAKAFEKKNMIVWTLPLDIHQAIPAIPSRIYINKDIVKPMESLLRAWIDHQHQDDEIKTWDGCFNIRMVRGSTFNYSMHSFGVAFDINAYSNPMGGKVTFSPAFLDTARKLGWTCGADFKRTDGMHFEYTKHIA